MRHLNCAFDGSAATPTRFGSLEKKISATMKLLDIVTLYISKTMMLWPHLVIEDRREEKEEKEESFEDMRTTVSGAP